MRPHVQFGRVRAGLTFDCLVNKFDFVLAGRVPQVWIFGPGRARTLMNKN